MFGYEDMPCLTLAELWFHLSLSWRVDRYRVILVWEIYENFQFEFSVSTDQSLGAFCFDIRNNMYLRSIWVYFDGIFVSKERFKYLDVYVLYLRFASRN